MLPHVRRCDLSEANFPPHFTNSVMPGDIANLLGLLSEWGELKDE